MVGDLNDQSRSSEGGDTVLDEDFGAGRLGGSIAMRAASNQGSQASRMACVQNANGLAASNARPNASKDGTAWSVIEICSLSPSGDWLYTMSMFRPGSCALALVVSRCRSVRGLVMEATRHCSG